MKNPIQALFFSGTSVLTKYFPHFGAWLLDFPIRRIVGHRWLSALFDYRNRTRLARVRGFKRILVNPDVHIGDAIMAQALVTALRDFFPDAEIDFVANRGVTPLLEGNPEVNRFLPMYSGGAFPPESELAAVRAQFANGNYDLCINGNPFLSGDKLTEGSRAVIDVTTHAPTLVRNESSFSEVNHFAFQHVRFVHGLLGRRLSPRRESAFAGVSLRLSDAAIDEARAFLSGFAEGLPLVMMNADTASPYTRIPLPDQIALAERLLEGGAALVIGAGHSEQAIGRRLADSLPASARARVRLIPPEMPLSSYAALIDRCDAVITGDTGPMHVAAARKVSQSGNYPVKNQTAVVCIFGATPARMSGYDSFQPGYLAANQDAPSWTVVAGSPCRNITCINKLFKTCETVRCFEVLAMEPIYAAITPHLFRAAGALKGMPEDKQSPR